MRLPDQSRLATLRSYEPAAMERDHGLDTLCDMVRLTLGVPMAAVTLVDEERTHHVGMSGLLLDDVPTRLTFCSHTIEGDHPMLVEDATQDPRFASNPWVLNAPGIRFYVGAPLIAPDGSALGAICGLDTTSRSCPEPERAKLQSLARTAVQILELRRRMLEAQALALTDRLTRLANRLGIETEIDKAIALGARHGVPFSLIYFDVDHFKAVNDSQGHAAGDRLLELIGRTLSRTTRRGEACGRLGGDEFVILLLGTDGETGAVAAERIKRNLDEAVAEEGFAVSFSMGLAHFPEPPVNRAAALGAADSLLYRAKRGGKNRIVASRESMDA